MYVQYTNYHDTINHIWYEFNVKVKVVQANNKDGRMPCQSMNIINKSSRFNF